MPENSNGSKLKNVISGNIPVNVELVKIGISSKKKKSTDVLVPVEVLKVEGSRKTDSTGIFDTLWKKLDTFLRDEEGHVSFIYVIIMLTLLSSSLSHCWQVPSNPNS